MALDDTQTMIITAQDILGRMSSDNIERVCIGLVDAVVPIAKPDAVELLQQSIRCDNTRKFRVHVGLDYLYWEILHINEKG